MRTIRMDRRGRDEDRGQQHRSRVEAEYGRHEGSETYAQRQEAGARATCQHVDPLADRDEESFGRACLREHHDRDEERNDLPERSGVMCHSDI